MRRAILVLALTLTIIIGHGIVRAESMPTVPVQHGPVYDHDALEGVIIDSVEIDNRNVFDTRRPEYDNILFKTANRLHMITRDAVIRRELLFDAGEPFSYELAEETARNLRARYELYDAWIEPERLNNGGLLVRVVTIDLWSFLVATRIQRDGNETNYQVGIEERNLLGYNQFFSIDYFVQQKDANYIRTIYRNPRAWGQPYLLGLTYNDEPTNYERNFTFSRPYYNLSQRFTFGLSVINRGGRRDQYFNTELIAQSHNRGDQIAAWVGYRWGQYKRKTGLQLNYDYVYETTRGEDTINLDYAQSVFFPSDSIYHRLMLTLNWQRLAFTTMRRINGFSYTEDFTLGQSISLEAGRAFEPGLGGYLYDQLGFSASHSSRIGSNLFSLSYDRIFWFRAGADYRHSASLSLRWYNNGLDFMTVALRGLYVSDWDAEGRNYLVLGGTSGLRGFNKYYLTGNRLMIFNVEDRFFPQVELLSVIFGGAIFADIGKAWKSEDAFRFSRFEASVGAGLRISLEKSAKSEIIRIDAAYGQDRAWQLSVGTGQYF